MYGIGTEVSPSSGRLQTVIRSRNAIVAVFPHPNDGPVELAGGTERTGVNFHVKTDGNNDLDGLSWETAVATFTKAIDLATAGRGDQIHARPGDYDEAEINVNKADLTIIGHGADGAVGITPAAGISAMKITANDVVLQNLRIEGNATADYALQVTDAVLGFRSYGVLYRGGEGSNPAIEFVGVGDAYIVGGEIAWAGVGIEFADSTGFNTQVHILGVHFHNITATHILSKDLGDTTGGGVRNLRVQHCSHDNLEVGTVPTAKIVAVAQAGSTGLFSDNTYPITDTTAQMLVATGILWVANKIPAGLSDGQPS